MNLVLVGGGKPSLVLLDYFQARDGFRISGVADPDENAPGILRARERNIPTSTHLEDLIQSLDSQVVIELTGIHQVAQRISDLLRPDQEMMSFHTTRLMLEMIKSERNHNRENIRLLQQEFRHLSERLSNASNGVHSSLQKVGTVFRTMKILSLNAMIEASRAGEAGDAFAVVAEEMKNLLGNAEMAFEEIAEASLVTGASLETLSQAKTKLQSIIAR